MITLASATNVEEIPGLKALWTETLGDPRICIAILDGPVDQSHPSLATANLTKLETLVPGIGNQGPASQHGTHIASLIFGQHHGPIKGIAPHCRGVIVPIFQDGSDGSIAPCSQLDLARAITQAVEAGADIINISGGELSLSGTAHPLLATAVQRCAARGILIIAAAGNEGCECLHVPGALPSVLAVGTMNSQGLPLGFTNWGTAYRTQGILAPGENILVANIGGGTTTRSGTSYAAPIVSGVAGLLLSLHLKLGRKSNPQAVRAAMLDSAHACDPQAVLDCRPFMVGSLNISGAYALIKKRAQEGAFNRLSDNNEVDRLASQSQPARRGGDTMPEVGEVAPDFTLKNHAVRDVRLSNYQGKTVILWFYPKADTYG
jgi:cyanobactin maturation PatA/PatG family protease